MLSRDDREGFKALLAQVPLSDRVKAELSDMMDATDRHYHGVAHLALLWRRHKLYAAAEGMTAPDIETLIACAIAFHDCVYVGGRRDNEERSAEFWVRSSAGTRFSEAERKWVAGTIMATSDHLGYVENFALARGTTRSEAAAAIARERARIWVLDLDLTPLGETAAKFDCDTQLLRREVSHLTDAEWEAGRRAFLRRLSNAAVIYRTPTLAAVFEAQARSNFERKLQDP